MIVIFRFVVRTSNYWVIGLIGAKYILQVLALFSSTSTFGSAFDDSGWTTDEMDLLEDKLNVRRSKI